MWWQVTHFYFSTTRDKTESHTVLPSGNVHILAESGVSDGFENLETSQDFDGVGSQRESIASTDIMWKSWGKEGKGS